MTSPFTLMLVADEFHFRQGVAEHQIVRAIEGGVTCVQLREKTCSDREFIQLALKVMQITRLHRVPVLINDRIVVAKTVGAHGVHLGQSDDAPFFAREVLGPHAIIGFSVETEDHALVAQKLPINYLGVSSVFETPTKKDIKRVWGIKGVTKLRSLTALPLVGIGGINETNAADVIAAGADGVALVSSFRAREDWKLKAKVFRKLLEGAHATKNY